MTPRRTFFAASALLSVPWLVGASAIAHAALSNASASSVTFRAVGPAGLEIRGTTSELAISETDGSIAIVVRLSQLSTGIGLRDQHMRDKYLEVQKFPTATLVVTRGALRFPTPGGTSESDVPANLTLHGQTHGVLVHYAASATGDGVTVKGSVRINMKDYGISVPTYLGVTVKPEVDLSATFAAAGH